MATMHELINDFLELKHRDGVDPIFARYTVREMRALLSYFGVDNATGKKADLAGRLSLVLRDRKQETARHNKEQAKADKEQRNRRLWFESRSRKVKAHQGSYYKTVWTIHVQELVSYGRAFDKGDMLEAEHELTEEDALSLLSIANSILQRRNER